MLRKELRICEIQLMENNKRGQGKMNFYGK